MATTTSKQFSTLIYFMWLGSAVFLFFVVFKNVQALETSVELKQALETPLEVKLSDTLAASVDSLKARSAGKFKAELEEGSVPTTSKELSTALSVETTDLENTPTTSNLLFPPPVVQAIQNAEVVEVNEFHSRLDQLKKNLSFIFGHKSIIPAVLVGMMTTAVHYGWENLAEMFTKAGYFDSICSAEEDYDACLQQWLRKMRLTAFGAVPFGAFVGGVGLDLIGARNTVFAGLLVAAASWTLFSIPSGGTTELILRFLGSLLLGMSTDIIYQPLLRVSSLVPGSESRILSTLSGFGYLSALIPMILSLIYVSDSIPAKFFPLVTMSYAILGLGLCGYLVKQFLSIPVMTKENRRSRNTEIEQREQLPAENRTASYRSPELLQAAAIAIINSLRVSFYMGTYESQLTTSSGSTAATYFRFVPLLSFLPAMYVGNLIDRFGARRTTLVHNILAFVTYLLLNFDHIALKYSSALIYWIYMSFDITAIYAAIKAMVSPSQLGVYTGAIFCLSGILSFLSLWLNDLATNTFASMKPYDYLVSNLIVMGFSLLAIGFATRLDYLERMSKKAAAAANIAPTDLPSTNPSAEVTQTTEESRTPAIITTYDEKFQATEKSEISREDTGTSITTTHESYQTAGPSGISHQHNSGNV